MRAIRGLVTPPTVGSNASDQEIPAPEQLQYFFHSWAMIPICRKSMEETDHSKSFDSRRCQMGHKQQSRGIKLFLFLLQKFPLLKSKIKELRQQSRDLLRRMREFELPGQRQKDQIPELKAEKFRSENCNAVATIPDGTSTSAMKHNCMVRAFLQGKFDCRIRRQLPIFRNNVVKTRLSYVRITLFQ